jgi:hypothetical protein
VQASLGDDVDLDGGIAAGVVDGTSVDLGDRHGGLLRGVRRVRCNGGVRP